MSDKSLGKTKRPPDNEITKLNKRRQNIKESEQKRRERINEKFEQVTSLLHSSEVPPRATKEAILQEAIQRIKELQSRRYTPTSLTFSLPWVTPSFDRQEIEAGFNVLFKQESARLPEIRSESQLASSRQSCSRIIELADLCNKDDYRLYAFMTAATFYQIVSYDPDESIRFMDMALPFYYKLKQGQVSLSYFGIELGAWIHVCYAISLVSKGQFDRAMEHFDKAVEIARVSEQDFCLRRVYNGLKYIKYGKGETLTQEELAVVKSVNVDTPQSKFCILSNLIESKAYRNDTEKERLISDLEDSVAACTKDGGTVAFSYFRSASLSCYQTNPDAGLEHARQLRSFMNMGITGMNSKCDLLRNIAKLLIAKGGSENRYEAKKTLEEAIHLGLRTGFVVATLMSIMDILPLCDPGTPEFCGYVTELEDLTDLVAKNSIKQRSIVVEQAKVLIEKYKRENVNL